ncbi:hypothetical protein P8C59_007971 [Phyllachora maydis]|uniref:Decapping nuclease n=1 Tax=Phyllachora maydis TaxID=1825666 RepID=A0AAD9IAU4_9PEZI|nr:hypothetical protein P8C59_007971 [Phyllachora maydis]
MTATFSIQGRSWGGESEPVKRPKEFACFSYDADHKFHIGASSLKCVDEHLDSLLKTVMHHEQQTGKEVDAHIMTWRGIMTKIMSAPFDDRDGFEMNATLYRGCIFIEENHEFKVASRREQNSQPWRGPIPQEVMQFWGYKFETLSTLPRPWGETSRDYIENRGRAVVSNKEQYCSVVRTGIGKTNLCLGGEVDAIWDSKPPTPGAPISWVELKTSAEIRSDRDLDAFERKLLKFWVQSFLLGVPRIVVGFRSREGVLRHLEEIDTAGIPATAARRGRAGWDGNACINFASAFLAWLRETINDEGVWRIRRKAKSPVIEVFRVEEVGHGSIILDDFMNWRIKLSLAQSSAPGEEARAEA